MSVRPAGSTAGSTAGWSRRRLLGTGLGGLAALAAAGGGGLELVARGILPGQQALARLDGACTVSAPRLPGAAGPQFSGTFYSRARQQPVAYTIAYPAGQRPGTPLPLIVALHGFGADHRSVLAGLAGAQVLASQAGPRLPPVAIAAADGGGGYWNPHPGDDPMGMVIREFIPLCQRRGLGRGPRAVATFGVSMGGYGALLLAEKYPALISAVAAVSPAIWTSYRQARAANAGAYASAAAFTAADAVTHARALAGKPVRVAIGVSDPFLPGVRALARVLPDAAVVISQGCHTGPFFASQDPPSLAFLARHLAAP